jgi:hypothetical protein
VLDSHLTRLSYLAASSALELPYLPNTCLLHAGRE